MIDAPTNTVTADIPVAPQPPGVAVSPDGSRVYITNNAVVGTVSVIDARSDSVIAAIPVGSAPRMGWL